MTPEQEIDVPDSRQVTLPAEVPVGRVKLTVQTPTDPLAPLPGTSAKFQRERLAFHRLLPELLTTHAGKVVAIHDEQVIAVGDERIPVVQEAYKLVGHVPLYVERVEATRPVYRLRGPRDIRSSQS